MLADGKDNYFIGQFTLCIVLFPFDLSKDPFPEQFVRYNTRHAVLLSVDILDDVLDSDAFLEGESAGGVV